MPATAACLVETPFEEELSEETAPLGTPSRPLHPGARPAPAPAVRRRFHVSTRPVGGRQSRAASRTSLTGAAVFWALPVLGLLFIVVWSTLQIKGAYYRDHLQSRIAALQIERMDLEAEKRRLQAPRLILYRASRELGMVPAGDREFARLSAEEKVALEGRR